MDITRKEQRIIQRTLNAWQASGDLTPADSQRLAQTGEKEEGATEAPGETQLRHGPGVPGGRELNLGNGRCLRQA
jgi:hypothetical protein